MVNGEWKEVSRTIHHVPFIKKYFNGRIVKQKNADGFES